MKKRSSKYLQIAAYLMLSAIFVFVIGIARDCSRLPSSPIEGHSGGDTLDIALLFGPGSYFFYGDTLGGINQEIAGYFEKAMGSPIKLWPATEPSAALAKLRSGTFDILASLPLDNSLKSEFPVSESIFLDKLVLIQLADSVTGDKKVNSSLDLNGRTVSVAAGSSGAKRMNNLANEIGGNIIVEELPDLSDELLCLQVVSGNIPLAVVNERIAAEIADKYPLLKYDSTISFTQFQVWVFNPADSVAYNKFNEWFDNFRTSDDYRAILNKY